MLPLVGALAVGCQGVVSGPEEVRRERTEAHMGTAFRIVVYGEDTSRLDAAMSAAFARVAALDAAMTDYDRSSELSLLSSTAVDAPVRVSPDLFSVLDLAARVSTASSGAFDVTVGPAMALWRRARRQGKLPRPERLEAAREAIGASLVELDPDAGTVRLARPGMRLDLGGIAKGYAAQAAFDVLEAAGFPRAIVDAGGDVVCGDPLAGAEGWSIGLTALDGHPSASIQVQRAAVATSGDLFRFLELDGVRYSHVLDPRTGLGVVGRRQATVVAPDGAVADALASVACVLDPQDALQVIARWPGVEAEIAFEDGSGVQSVRSAGFPGRLSRAP